MRQFFLDLRFAMRGLLWLDALHHGHLDDLDPAVPASSRHVLPEQDYAFQEVLDNITGSSPGDLRHSFYLPRDALFLDVIGNLQESANRSVAAHLAAMLRPTNEITLGRSPK